PGPGPGPNTGSVGNKVKPDSVGGVSVEMVVDGKKQDFRENSAQGETVAWQVTSPAAGKPIAFKLKNNRDKKRAIVLRLNGVNMINQQKTEPESSGKFVLEPGKEVTINGFIMVEAPEGNGEGKAKRKVVPIKVLSGDAAKSAREELGEKAG